MTLLTQLLIVVLIITLAAGGAIYWITVMPGQSWQGESPPLTADQQVTRDALRSHIVTLADDIGERNVQRPSAYDEARQYLYKQMVSSGLSVDVETFTADVTLQGGEPEPVQMANVVAEKAGEVADAGVVIIGAHYDTVPGSPGANDNGSGLAAVLHLARYVASHRYEKSVRLVAFANEESPYFGTQAMGSLRHLQMAQGRNEQIVAMLSLETIGSFSHEAGSQNYPPPFSFLYPSTGNFIGFVGNLASRALVHQSITAFREVAQIPSEAVAAPSFIKDVGRSDHLSYWQADIPALMVTDTANFRYSQYHRPDDTSDVINFESITHVVTGLENVVDQIAVRISE